MVGSNERGTEMAKGLFGGLWGRKTKAIVYGLLSTIVVMIAQRYFDLDADSAAQISEYLFKGTGLYVEPRDVGCIRVGHAPFHRQISRSR